MSKTLTASWAAEPGADRYEAEYRVAGGNWTPMYKGPATSASVTVYQDGTAAVRVRALAGATAGPWAEQSIGVSGAGSGLSVSLSASGVSAVSAQSPVTTRSVVVQAAGGVRPYTYSWERVSGAGRISMLSPGASSCAFSGALAVGETLSEQFRCRVTDANGAQANSPTLTVTLERVAGVVPDISGFDLTDEPELAPELRDGVGVFVWDAVTDPAVTGIELRHAPVLTGAVWEDSQLIVRVAATAVDVKLTLLQGTYLIKALGANDAQSALAAEYVYEPMSAIQMEGLRVVPIGMPIPWPLGTAPAGDKFVRMDGSTLDSAEYPELAAFYGAGGATFTVADWRGLPLWGAADDETPGDVVGDDLLNLLHTHAAGTLAIAAHTHGAGTLQAASHTHSAGSLESAAHTHGAGSLTTTVPSAFAGEVVEGHVTVGEEGPAAVTGSTASSGPHAVSGSTGSSGALAVSGSTGSAGGASATGSTGDAAWASLATPEAVDKRPSRVLVDWYQRARV